MNEKLEYVKNEIKKGFKEFKNGTETMFKEFFNKETNKKQRANMWTFLRLIIPVGVVVCSAGAMTLASSALYGITAGLVGFGAITDYFDGKSARKHGSTSEYGKLLDQVADKVFAGIVGINLLLINPLYLIILLGELLIAGVNVGYKIKYNDLDIKSSFIGKIKEWPLFVSLGLGFLSPINSTMLTVANGSIALTTLFQLLTACSYVKNNTEELNKIQKENTDKVELSFEENDEEIKEKELVLAKENKGTSKQIEELKEFRNTLIENTDEKAEEKIDNTQKTKTLS